MKKFLQLLIPIVMQAGMCNAQAFDWAKQVGGSGADEVAGITTDASGNVLAVGYFEGSVDFDLGAGTYNLTSAGGRDAYLMKTDAHGNLLWAKQIGATGRDGAYKVRTDAAGNVYVLGAFEGTVDLDPGPGLSLYTSRLSGTVQDLFMVKLNAAGQTMWVARRQAVNTAWGLHDCDIKLDAAGSVYICYAFGDGYATDRIDIEKIDGSNGSAIWNRMIRSHANTNDALMNANLALDGSGNVLVAGEFSGLARFDQNSTTSLNGNWATAYVVRLDNAGNFGWVKLIGESSNGVARAFDIATDASGNIFVAGRFLDIIDFDPGAGVHNENSNYYSKGYVLKLSNAGSFGWVRHWGETWATNNAFGVATDAAGAVYVTGHFRDSCTFGTAPNTVSFKSNISNVAEAYVAKFGSGGTLEWARHMGKGPGDTVSGNAIAVSNMGVVYTAGSFEQTADFNVGSIPGFSLSSAGGSDGFIQRVAGCPAVNNGVSSNGFTLTASATGAGYQWINCSTNTAVAGATSQSFTPAVSGSYAVVIMQGGCGDTSICTSVIGSGVDDVRPVAAAIYPNPTTGNISIALNKQYSNVEVVITSAMGAVVSQTQYHNTSSVNAYIAAAEGVYFISTVADGAVIARERVVKLK